MKMQRRAPNILREWALLGVELVLLHAGLFAAWALLEPHFRRSTGLILVLTAIYLLVGGVISFIFVRRLYRADSPPEYEEARAEGIHATAKVLEVRRTRWRKERNRNFRLQVSPTRWEYVMRVRVSLPDEPDYEAEFAEFLSENVPRKGDKIKVRVHPQRPDVVVMAGVKAKRDE